jgi:class 3 adenylate cyclase
VTRRTAIIGAASALVFLIGWMFKSQHLAGANMMMFTGGAGFTFGFALSYMMERIGLEERYAAKISLLILAASVMSMCLSILGKFFQWGYSDETTLLSILLLFVYYFFFVRRLEHRQLERRRDRQLVAILFTDVTGFTRMMADNEERTLSLLKSLRKVYQTGLRKHRGRWIKEIGDGTLCVFFTASEAVLFALEVTKAAAADKLSLRIGIHVGEVVFTDKDIFGDGVNIAARIAESSEAGEIRVSDVVYQNIKNRENIKTHSLGTYAFKNVDSPLSVYGVNVPV